jgi:hypothetical protein
MSVKPGISSAVARVSGFGEEAVRVLRHCLSVSRFLEEAVPVLRSLLTWFPDSFK